MRRFRAATASERHRRPTILPYLSVVARSTKFDKRLSSFCFARRSLSLSLSVQSFVCEKRPHAFVKCAAPLISHHQQMCVGCRVTRFDSCQTPSQMNNDCARVYLCFSSASISITESAKAERQNIAVDFHLRRTKKNLIKFI